MLDLATGVLLIVLGLLTAIFRLRFEAYLDRSAGKAARDFADHGFSWPLAVYPTQRRLLSYTVPPFLVVLGTAFLYLGVT